MVGLRQTSRFHGVNAAPLVSHRSRKPLMPELPSPVREAIDAFNAADIDAFTALFNPVTGYINDWGREFRGAEAIRRWSDQHFIGQQIAVDVLTFYLTDDRETVVIARVADGKSNIPATYSFGVDGESLTYLQVLA